MFQLVATIVLDGVGQLLFAVAAVNAENAQGPVGSENSNQIEIFSCPAAESNFNRMLAFDCGAGILVDGQERSFNVLALLLTDQ